MSHPTRRPPLSNGQDRRPGTQLYRRWREANSLDPRPGHHDEHIGAVTRNLREDDASQRPANPSSFSGATTLTNGPRSRHPPTLHASLSELSLARPLEEASYSPPSTPPDSRQLSLSPSDDGRSPKPEFGSQHSLARPLEEASYSLPPSLPDSRQPSVSSHGTRAEPSASDSQISLARPLEEATYPSSTSPSPPLSEPASTWPPSTRSSGPYLPPAWAWYRYRSGRPLENFTGGSLSASPPPYSPRGFREEPPWVNGPPGTSTTSAHSLARPVEERSAWDTSPPASLLAEAVDDVTPASSQHSFARPLEEVPVLQDTDMINLLPLEDRLATTTRPRAHQTTNQFRRRHVPGNRSAMASPELSAETLESIRNYRFGRGAEAYHSDGRAIDPGFVRNPYPVDSNGASSPSLSPTSLSAHPRAPPPSLSDSRISSRIHSPSTLSLSVLGTDPMPQVTQFPIDRTVHDPRTRVHRHRPRPRLPTRQDRALSRRQLDAMVEQGTDLAAVAGRDEGGFSPASGTRGTGEQPVRPARHSSGWMSIEEATQYVDAMEIDIPDPRPDGTGPRGQMGNRHTVARSERDGGGERIYRWLEWTEPSRRRRGGG